MKNYTIKTIFIAFLILLTNNIFCIDIVPLEKENLEQIEQVQHILEQDLDARYAIFEEKDGGLELAMKYIVSKNLITLVAKDDNGLIVGVINYHTKLSKIGSAIEWITSWFTLKKIPRNIHILIVDQDCRGQKIGTLLMKAALTDLYNHKITSIQLSVNPKNTHAQAFYTKLDFKKNAYSSNQWCTFYINISDGSFLKN
ncbi:GNAT family N-acetyltransferase [Candidatus Babeliales bacterium]|nr:GNAT family N-acetyltransferase [Candidatus Babeliales bacterium]